MTSRALLAEVDSRLGCRSLSRARSTGTLVGVYQAAEAGIEDDPATPWATVCEDHGSVVCHYNLADARGFASCPEEWCDECREIAVERALPAELRESEAFADSREGAKLLWEQGFRPMPASSLKTGMLVSYVDTMFGFVDGAPKTARVLSVERKGYELVFEHTSGHAEEDEGAEVWAK